MKKTRKKIHVLSGCLILAAGAICVDMSGFPVFALSAEPGVQGEQSPAVIVGKGTVDWADKKYIVIDDFTYGYDEHIQVYGIDGDLRSVDSVKKGSVVRFERPWRGALRTLWILDKAPKETVRDRKKNHSGKKKPGRYTPGKRRMD